MISIRHTFYKAALMAGLACFLLAPQARADQVILDDLIVDGSACIGFDCVNGESFGFDTLRLKENNLRVKFDDTSSSASFPNNDWQLTANDSANGGANKFSIDDISGGRTPFTIEAGAPSHSLYVDDGGRLGLGTNTPVVDVHIKSGNTPTLRLEQDGSSGFTPQTWDVAGNEAGFFIRDATNGSTLPFRIIPGASSQALVIGANSNVGIGTDTTPDAQFHIENTAGNDVDDFVVTSAGAVGIGTAAPGEELDIRPTNDDDEGELAFHNDDTAGPWVMRHRPEANGGFFHFDNAGGAVEFSLSPGGALTILGSITTGGPTCGGGCDFVFDPGYELESIEEHAERMWENSHLPAVGPTPDEGKSFNVTEKVGGMLNELEKAHIYIERLNEKLNQKDVEVGELTQRLARLEALMSK